MKIKDDLLKMKIDKDFTLNLDGQVSFSKDILNKLPDDILVKKAVEDITLNQGKINEIIKLRSV